MDFSRKKSKSLLFAQKVKKSKSLLFVRKIKKSKSLLFAQKVKKSKSLLFAQKVKKSKSLLFAHKSQKVYFVHCIKFIHIDGHSKHSSWPLFLSMLNSNRVFLKSGPHASMRVAQKLPTGDGSRPQIFPQPIFF